MAEAGLSRSAHELPPVDPNILAQVQAKIELYGGLDFFEERFGLGEEELTQQVTFNGHEGSFIDAIVPDDPDLFHNPPGGKIPCPAGGWIAKAYAEGGLKAVQKKLDTFRDLDPDFNLVISSATTTREVARDALRAAGHTLKKEEKLDSKTEAKQPEKSCSKVADARKEQSKQAATRSLEEAELEAAIRATRHQHDRMHREGAAVAERAEPKPTSRQSEAVHESHSPVTPSVTRPDASKSAAPAQEVLATETSLVTTTEQSSVVVSAPTPTPEGDHRPEVAQTVALPTLELPLVSQMRVQYYQEQANQNGLPDAFAGPADPIDRRVLPDTSLESTLWPIASEDFWGSVDLADDGPELTPDIAVLTSSEVLQENEQAQPLLASLPEVVAVSLEAFFETAKTEAIKEVENMVAVIAIAAERLHVLAAGNQLESKEAMQIEKFITEWYTELLDKIGVEADEELIADFIKNICAESYGVSADDMATEMPFDDGMHEHKKGLLPLATSLRKKVAEEWRLFRIGRPACQRSVAVVNIPRVETL